MQTYDQSLMWFYQNDAISFEQALQNSTTPEDFKLRVDGILSGSDRGWAEFAKLQSDLDVEINEEEAEKDNDAQEEGESA